MAWLRAPRGRFPEGGGGDDAGWRRGAGARSPWWSSRPHRPRLPDLPRGCSAGGYLLPRKPACLLAPRVQEAQQAVL